MSANAPDLNRDIPGFITPVIVVKTADETVNNSATLQDDDELKFYVEPYSTWRWEMYAQYSSATTPDFKWQVTIPTGATGNMWTIGPIAGINTPLNMTYATPVTFDGAGVSTLLGLWITGLVVVGATAGFVTLQWAQGTANASDTKVREGSSLMAWNLTPFKVKP